MPVLYNEALCDITCGNSAVRLVTGTSESAASSGRASGTLARLCLRLFQQQPLGGPPIPTQGFQYGPAKFIRCSIQWRPTIQVKSVNVCLSYARLLLCTELSELCALLNPSQAINNKRGQQHTCVQAFVLEL